MSFQVRQGDVFIERLPSTPPAGTPVIGEDPVTLMPGAAIGHAHRVVAVDQRCNERPAAQLFEDPNGRRLLLVGRACELRHDEHAPIALAPGAYSVTIQREYEPEGVRNDVD